jgi:hypothetical protein
VLCDVGASIVGRLERLLAPDGDRDVRLRRLLAPKAQTGEQRERRAGGGGGEGGLGCGQGGVAAGGGALCVRGGQTKRESGQSPTPMAITGRQLHMLAAGQKPERSNLRLAALAAGHRRTVQML